MERGEYIERLRALLNEGAENGLEEITLEGTDTVNIEKLIDDTYPMAWTEVPKWAKKSIAITDASPRPLEESGSNSQVGYINLPSDYYDLVSLQMRGWKIPVTSLVSRSSHQGRSQGYMFARGTPSRPVGVIEYDPTEDVWKIYYYSLPLGHRHHIQELRIIAKPDINNIDVKDDFINLLLIQHAIHIGSILGRSDMVNLYIKIRQDELQNRMGGYTIVPREKAM